MPSTKTNGRSRGRDQDARTIKKKERRLIHVPAKKYHFMLGTTSRVPDAPGWHYLILDIDKKICPPTWLGQPRKVTNVFQLTQSGCHVYSPIKMRLKPMLRKAIKFGADRTWARLALKRGWAFLADKGEVKIPWPVERMVIGWRKNENLRSKLMEKSTSTRSGERSPRKRP